MFSAAQTQAPLRLTLRRARTLEDRVQAMRRQVWDGLRDPVMRRLSLAVCAGDAWTIQDVAAKEGARPFDVGRLRPCVSRDEGCELWNSYAFVKDNVRYTGDPTGLDLYATARRTLIDFRAGDCDDASICHFTILGHNGWSLVARLTANHGSVDARGRPVIGHIYAVALAPKFTPKVGVALDSTLPRGTLGTEAAYLRRVDYRVL